MEIEGKIVQILEAQKGTSQKGEWKKQSFVVETAEQFPKKVCIDVFNDKIPLSSFSTGNMVKVYINLESREFNGKWYTNVNGWKIEILGAAAHAPSAPTTTSAPAAASTEWTESSDGGEDLPF